MTNIRENFKTQILKYAKSQEDIDACRDEVLTKKYIRDGNKATKKLYDLHLEVFKNQEQSVFEELMSHENKYVRFMAANLGYNVNIPLAKKTLEEIIELPSPNMLGAHARLALEAWQRSDARRN